MIEDELPEHWTRSDDNVIWPKPIGEHPGDWEEEEA